LSAGSPHVADAYAGYGCFAVIARSECDEAIQFFFTALDRFAVARDDEFWTKLASPDKSTDHFSARHPFSS
jgi:hypothetical protein